MKIKVIYLVIILCLLGNLVVGCTRKEELVKEEMLKEEGEEMIDYEEAFTLNELINRWARLPKTNGKYDAEEITKIMYTRWKHMHKADMFGVDLVGKELYTDPNQEAYSWESELPDYEMTEEDVLAVRSMIEQYEIASWEGYYGEMEESGPDVLDGGPGWTLILQFNDGKIRRIEGSGNENDFPDGKKDFVREMIEFAGSKEANIVREDEREWLTGRSSYLLSGYSGEQIEVRLSGDMEEHGYELSIINEDIQEIIIKREEEIYTQGSVGPSEMFISLIEDVELSKNTTVIERRLDEYPQYLYYHLEGHQKDWWIYEIKLDEYSSALSLINTISEESAREIYELLSFEVVTE